MKNLINFIIYPPCFLLLFLNIAPSFFLPHIIFDNAPETYLPKEQPSVQLKNELEALFPGGQNAIVLFHGHNLYSDQFLDLLDKATKKMTQSALIERVVSVTEMEHIEGTEDGFEVSELLGKETRQAIKRPEERYLYAKKDRQAKGLTVSDTDQYMAIMIRPDKVHSTLDRIRVLEYVDKVLAEFGLKSYVMAQAGSIVVEVEQYRSMLRDTLKFVPGTIILGLLLIWFIFRHGLAVLITLLTTGAVVNTTMLLYVLFSVPYTMISSMLAPLLASLTIALLIHFYSYMKQASSLGYQGTQRTEYALEHIRKPAFFTALTTALGLSSLAVSPILPIVHFGLISAFGVVLLCVLVLFVIPTIFIKFDHKKWFVDQNRKNWVDQLLRQVVNLSIRRAAYVIVFFVLFFALGIPFIFNVSAETNLLKFFPEGHFVTKNTQLVEDKMVGVMPLEIILRGNSRDSLKKLKNLKQIEALQDWLERQEEIDKTSSLVDFFKEMNKAVNLNAKAYYKLPESNQAISQYFFIYDGDEVYELVNRDFDITRIIISLHEHNSSKIRKIIERIEHYLDNNISQMKWQIGGNGRLFADQDKLLITGQINSLFVAVVMIFLVMFYMLKDLPLSLLSMLPNLSPILSIFIFMGFMGIKLDMATAMIASVAIGIAVDDTIHLVYGFKKRLDKGASILLALVRSYYKTGRAIVVTTVILCAQFLLVASADFIPISYFGLLTAICLFIALIFDLVLLPALIVVFFHRPKFKN